jgi:hypothetical protein
MKKNPLKSLLKIKPIYLFIALLIVSVISIISLRANNQEMGSLRNKVFSADKSGQNVQGALNDLRNYVNSHMNTNLSSGQNSVYPPIQLKYTYQRLVVAENTQAKLTNSNIYHDAQIYCQQINSSAFSGRTRVPCIESYVQSHGVKTSPIPTGLYEFDFISPSWSPDLAGWSLLLCSLLLFLLGINIIYNRISRDN